jgi:hypothetical protein
MKLRDFSARTGSGRNCRVTVCLDAETKVAIEIAAAHAMMTASEWACAALDGKGKIG